MQTKTLWIATGNPGKANELHFLAKKTFATFQTIYHQAPLNVVEDEPTFSGNAKKKSYALTKELLQRGATNFSVLGDDSGICVDFLHGAPGIYSARYAGLPVNSQRNIEKLLTDLVNVKELQKRTASYQCALSMVGVENRR